VNTARLWKDFDTKMKTGKLFIIIFMLMLATRFSYFLYIKPYSPSHARFSELYEMERAGINLAKEGTIANIYGADSGISAHVAPLYPGFLALIDRLGGLDMARFRFAEGISAIISTALCAALMPALATRARLSKGVGTGAALLMVLSPLGMWFEIRGDWETTFVPLVLVAAFWSLMALEDHSWRNLRTTAATGIMIGVGALLSPVVLVGVLLALLGEALACRCRARAFRLALGGSVLLGATALAISPWIYRNYVCFSALVPIRSNFGIEFAVGNHPSNRDGSTYDSGMDFHPSLNAVEREKLKAVGEVNYNRMKLHETWAWVQVHPARFAELTVRRLVLFWFPYGDAAWGPQSFIPVPMKSAWLGTVTVLAFGGMAWLFAAGHPYRWLIAGIFIGPSLPYLVTHVFLRYRYPLLWLTFLLGCECIARAINAATGLGTIDEVSRVAEGSDAASTEPGHRAIQNADPLA
jgi:hypothetical protein